MRKVPRAKARRYLVFVAHSGVDTWVAKQLAQRMKSAGATYFLDADKTELGDEYSAKIRGALKKAQEFVVLLTPDAAKSAYVWAEVGSAWGRGIRIVVILYKITKGELLARPDIPVFVKAFRLADINTETDAYIAELKKRVSKK